VPTIPIPPGYKPSSVDNRTKIKLVTNALIIAQNDAFAGMLILRRTEENKLDQLPRPEIIWALETIQKANRDLFLILPELSGYLEKGIDRLKPSYRAEHLDNHFGEKWRELLEDGAIVLRLGDRFDNWCEAQRHKKSISIANLSLESRAKVLVTVTAIYERFELSSNPNVTISWVPPSATENAEARTLSLEFLQNKDVVKRHEFHYTGGGSIEVEIDVKEFFRFREELLALYAPATNNEEASSGSPVPAVLPNPFASMEDLRWQDISIRFLAGHTVKISAKETSLAVDYRQMGFEDARTRLPNTQWALMQVLARQRGQLVWDNSEAADNIKKRKQVLSDTSSTDGKSRSPEDRKRKKDEKDFLRVYSILGPGEL
jgi:hypothetical protein